MKRPHVLAKPAAAGLAQASGKTNEAMKNDFDFSRDIARIEATTLTRRRRCRYFPADHAVGLFGLLGGGQTDPG